MTDFHMLSPDNPEWDRAWESLHRLTGCYFDRNPVSGEIWQYTGTCIVDRPAIGSLLPLELLVHQFRHRDRPLQCKPIPGAPNSFGRVYLYLTTSLAYSGGWNSPFREGALVLGR